MDGQASMIRRIAQRARREHWPKPNTMLKEAIGPLSMHTVVKECAEYPARRVGMKR